MRSFVCKIILVQILQANLEREAQGHNILIIWTDCDREGEHIGFEIIEVCRRINPNIDIYRAKFSEITPTAVTRAIHNLVQPDQRISDAVDVRMQLDLRIGLIIPILTKIVVN